MIVLIMDGQDFLMGTNEYADQHIQNLASVHGQALFPGMS